MQFGYARGRDRPLDVAHRDWSVEHGLEFLLLLRNALDLRHHVAEALVAHLDWVDDRTLDLRFECRRAAVPELQRVEKRVQNGRRVALAKGMVDAHRRRQLVGKALGRRMALIA
jgi:hypothetical protein